MAADARVDEDLRKNVLGSCSPGCPSPAWPRWCWTASRVTSSPRSRIR